MEGADNNSVSRAKWWINTARWSHIIIFFSVHVLRVANLVNSSTASTTDSAGILSPPSAHWAPWLVSKAFHANSAPRLHFPLIKNRPSNAGSARQISPVITFLRWNNTTVCRLSTSSSSHVLWAVLWTVGEKVQRCGCCCRWFAHWHTRTLRRILHQRGRGVCVLDKVRSSLPSWRFLL